MQKFSEFIKDHKNILENNTKSTQIEEFNSLYEAKLKELGAKTLLDLDEEQLEIFNSYIKSLKEAMSKDKKVENLKSEVKTTSKSEPLKEKEEVTDEKSFREYAESVLKKAHGDDYDEKIGNKVINGIISKVKDDNWGEAIGRLTSGLGK